MKPAVSFSSRGSHMEQKHAGHPAGEGAISLGRRGFIGSTGAAAAAGLIGAASVVASGEAKAGVMPRPRTTPRGAKAFAQRIARATANLTGVMAGDFSEFTSALQKAEMSERMAEA